MQLGLGTEEPFPPHTETAPQFGSYLGWDCPPTTHGPICQTIVKHGDVAPQNSRALQLLAHVASVCATDRYTDCTMGTIRKQ